MFTRFISKNVYYLNKSFIRFSSVLTGKFPSFELDNAHKGVLHVKINRPEKKNAMKPEFWDDTLNLFTGINEDKSIRAVVITANGPVFSAGIDFMALTQLMPKEGTDFARASISMRKIIRHFQKCFQAIEKCQKPVIAAINGPCVGGGVDFVCFADIRICSKEAWFQVKETELGLAADVGTLQLLPRLVGGESRARELIFTSRKFFADEALQCGFVSRVEDNPEALVATAIEMARRIASFSPVAVQTVKSALIYARDHGVDDGLRQIADWNQIMLQSTDLVESVKAEMQKKKAIYDDA